MRLTAAQPRGLVPFSALLAIHTLYSFFYEKTIFHLRPNRLIYKRLSGSERSAAR